MSRGTGGVEKVKQWTRIGQWVSLRETNERVEKTEGRDVDPNSFEKY